MAKIKKIIENGGIQYPATITDAVKNPNNGKTVTEELSELGSEVGLRFKFESQGTVLCPIKEGETYLIINLGETATFSTRSLANEETVQSIGTIEKGKEVSFTATGNANYLRCGQPTSGIIVNMSSYISRIRTMLESVEGLAKENRDNVLKLFLKNGVKALKGIYESSESAEIKEGESYYNTVTKSIVYLDEFLVKHIEAATVDGLYRIDSELYYFNGNGLVKFNLDARTNEIISEKIKTYIPIETEWIKGYIATAGIGNQVSLDVTSSTTTSHIIIDVTGGDCIMISASGGNNNRAYIIIDDNNIELDRANSDAVLTNHIIKMPDSASKLIVNSYGREDRGVSLGNDITKIYPNLNRLVLANSDEINRIAGTLIYDIDLKSLFKEGRSYTNKGNVGDVIIPTENSSTTVASVKINVKKGEQYILNGSGGDGSRLYSYHGLNNKIIDIAKANSKGEQIISITEDGYLYINCFVSSEYSLTGKCYGDKYIDILYRDIKSNKERIYSIESNIGKKYYSGADFERYELGEKVTMEYYSTFIKSADVYKLYDSLMERHTSNITKTLLGNDATGLPMYRYDFKPGKVEVDMEVRPIKVMILTGTHPEYMSIRALYKVMESIYDNWSSNNALSALRWNIEFIVIPIASPWAVDNASRVNSRGVDMNRNYPSGWVQGTYVEPPSTTSTYGGSEPLSELESQYINEILESNTDIVLGIDFHNHFGRDRIFWVPSKSEEIRNIAVSFMRQLTGTISKKYNYINIENIGYVGSNASGGTFAQQVVFNGIVGMTFETSNLNVSSQYDDDMIDISHCGFINYLSSFLRYIIK